MPPQAAFAVSVVLGFVVWGIVARSYLWPALRTRAPADALRPILVLHAFGSSASRSSCPASSRRICRPPSPIRPPTVISSTAMLALLALATAPSRLGIVLVWVFNTVGSVDLLVAFYRGNSTGVGFAPGLQGAAYFIPTVLVPLLLITHGLVFRLLLRSSAATSPDARGVADVGPAHARDGTRTDADAR